MVGLARNETAPTLVMLAHPRCPCTRASIAELARLAASVGREGMIGYVLFYRAEDADAAWAETDLWNSAAAIPGIRVEPDVGGRLAEAFGAVTSGQVVLYDAAGRLVFSGGITGARGHEGDNRGRDAIEHFFERGLVLESTTAVFGCEVRQQGCDGCASSDP
jgi:hypothetical protein